MKKHNILKKGMAMALSLAMVIGLDPSFAWNLTTVHAAEASSEPGVSAYAAKEQLMDDTFAPDAVGNATNIGKIKLGKNSNGDVQEWYVLGKDTGVDGENTAIFAASPIADGVTFEDSQDNKTYLDTFGAYADSSTRTEVYPNHYGASGLRARLNEMVADNNTIYFTTAEKSLIQPTTVSTKDTLNNASYTTTDILYALQGDYYENDKVLYAGSNNGKALPMNTYWNTGDRFWLRVPGMMDRSDVLVGKPGYYIDVKHSNSIYAVRPASNLNLSSVIFASAATADSVETEEAETIQTDTAMTLRLDGKDKNIGTITYNPSEGTVKATKGTVPSASIVVQGNNAGTDWYYSKWIMGNDDAVVTKDEIKAKISERGSTIFDSSDIDLNNCRIWLETTDADGMIYAVNATEEKVEPSYSMQIFVKAPGGKLITLDVESTDRIEDVKEKISDKEGIDVKQICLSFAGEELEDGNTLQDYSIQKDTTIHMTIKPVTLNISDGAIKITPTGYTQNGGDEIAFTGKYIITGSVECDTPLSFSNETDEAVEYDVTFDNAHILGGSYCSAITFKDGSISDITVNITNKGTSEVRAWGGASFQNQIRGNAKVTVNITEEEGSSLYLGPRDENQGDTTHRIYSSDIDCKDIDCKVNGAVPANEKTFKSGTYAQTEPETPGEDATKKSIGLGTSIIANPTIPTSTTDAWKGSYVYFGTYNGSPIKYRVLDSDTTIFSNDNTTNTMLLDCDSLLFESKFDDSSNEWANSYLKRYLNSEKGEGYDYSSEGFLTTAFTSSEQSAIASSTKIVDSSDGNEEIGRYFKWSTLNDDKIFLLDAKEACNTSYGYSKVGGAINRKKTGNNNDTTSWWLRSAVIPVTNAIGIVSDEFLAFENSVPSKKVYVSPDLNVNLSSILLSSATGVGKTSAITKDSNQINTIASNEWKLTLKDAGKTVNVTKNKAVTKSADGVITVPYTYTDTATTDAEKVNQISVMITDKAYTESDAQILYYGALQTDSINSGSGKGTFELPNGLDGKTLGSDYHVYILAEHINDTNATDYASEPVEITNIYNAINRVEATINQPKGGQQLSTAIECTTEEVEKAQLYWTDTTNNNVDTTAKYYPWTYKAHLSFTPKPGYAFTDATEIAVNGWGLGNEKSVNEDGTLTVTGDFESSRDKLLSITAPAPITVANGTAYDEIISKLPKQVNIQTEGNSTTPANVTWNTASPIGGSYDPSKMEEQKIILKGTVDRPEEIDFNNVRDTTLIEVTISAAETVNAPTADVAAGTYSSNQTVTLASSTDGATIYYTTDGTAPSIGDDGKPSGSTKKYSDAISVTGTQGLTESTTIKAFAVKSGMYPSAISEFVYTIEIPHVHSFANAEWKHDGTKHWKECTNENCDKSAGYISYESEHSGGTASYFKKAVCSTCGTEYGELATDTTLPTGEIKVKDNIWNSFLNTITFGKFFKETQKVTIAGTDDSYQADGFDASKNVKVSYLLVSGSDAKAYTTKALAEKYSAKEFKEYTESFNIDPDDKYVVFARIEDHAGNVTFVSSDGMIVDATAPTVNGLENNKTYCGDVKFTVTDEHLDKVTDTIGEETKTLEVVDGEYTLSAGTHKITATDKAGNKTEVDVTVNAGHTYGDWETVQAATCENNGEEKHECSVCGYAETRKIAATGHSWNDDYTVDTPPTCTAEGSKSIHCKNCDKVKDSTVIDALGHDFTGEWKVTKKATCTEPGTKERKCSRCDAVEIETIPTAGHSFGEWETVKSSTCNDKGSQKRVCKVCGYTETKDVDANGHAWEKDYTVDKEPTCTAEGSKSIHCKNCGEVKDSTVIDALGHDFTGEWKVTKKATCTEPGTKTRKCSRCDEVETEIIPATGHTEVEDAAVAATCTTAGKTAGSHCSVCNAVIKAQEEIPATGHSWSEWISDGKKEKSTCSVCGQKKYRNTDDTGKIEKEAEVTPDSPFGGASLDTGKEALIAAKGIFTPEEKAEVENGVNARIWVEISSTEDLTEDNRQKIEALAKKLMCSDISNITYFDAELFKSVTKDGVSTKSQINEPGAYIEISLRLPESLVSKDRFILRKYKVIRLHDGKVDSLDAEFDKETNTLKFVTDRFSTYAIAYTDNALASCVTLTLDSKTLTGKGETVQLIAAVTPDNAVNKKLTWTTSDSSVATVDENGLVTAVANGTAIITVTTEDGEMTATSTITVNIPSDDNSNNGNNNKSNSKPNTNSVILTDNKKHDNQKVISSKTGDTSDVTLWTTVFATALAGIIGIFARRKKKNN